MRVVKYLLAGLLVVGCGSDSENADTVGKEIADDYNRAMDEAAAVEEQLREQQRQLEEAIEDPE